MEVNHRFPRRKCTVEGSMALFPNVGNKVKPYLMPE